MEIIIPFARIKALNPNVSKKLAGDHGHDYYRCIVVAFMSIRKFNPEHVLVLVTNEFPPEEYDSVFRDLSIQVRIVEFQHIPPVDFGDRFRGCFYLFDAILAAKNDSLFIDPDVLCIGYLGDIEKILGDQLGVFYLDFPDNYDINGNTRLEAASIWKEFSSTRSYENASQSTAHLGGEILYVPKSKLNMINNEIKEFWDWNISRSMKGLPFLRTEEHILTCIFQNFQVESLNPYISRIWTARSYASRQGNDSDVNHLLLWHLPSEKTRGFRTLFFDYTGKREISDLDRDLFVKYSKRIFHVNYFPYRVNSRIKVFFRFLMRKVSDF